MARIDKEKCVGCSLCVSVCPEGIEMEDGKVKIKNKEAECLKKAADACPRNAIILE